MKLDLSGRIASLLTSSASVVALRTRLLYIAYMNEIIENISSSLFVTVVLVQC